MRSLFISDLHLSQHNPQVAAGFLRFLQTTALEAQQLYILGDFFDAWIGDDDDTAELVPIKNALKAYSQKSKLYFLRGNRDFLVGDRFAEEVGAELLSDMHYQDVAGRPAVILHGDTLCTEDTEYLQFRAMVHSPQWQQQVLALPLPQRRQMAADLRSKSQSLNAMKADDIMDVTPAEVDRIMSEANATLMIHGHTHRPKRHALADGRERIVLGDWHDTGWYLSATENTLELVEFEL